MKSLFLFVSFFFVQIIAAQADFKDPIRISVLTVGVADQSHSLYGHTAIRIKNENLGIDQVYNYGMFDFSTPNFIVRFVKGDMQYFAGAYPYADFEYNYKYENRSIYEQTLELSTENKLALIQALEASISGPDKYYTYKFIQRNCTTKVVDVLNQILQKNVIYKHDLSALTYREVLYPYAKDQFFQKLGINIIFGAKTDEQATKLFLPFDLKDNLNKTTFNGKPLVIVNKTLFQDNRNPDHIWWDSIYTLIFALALIVVANKKVITNTYFIVLGVLGIFFSLVGFYSFHEEISLNYNVLLFNPILLFVAYFDWRKNKKALLISSLVALTCTAIYFLYMLTKIHLAIVWPFIVVNSALLVRRLIVERKRKEDRE